MSNSGIQGQPPRLSWWKRASGLQLAFSRLVAFTLLAVGLIEWAELIGAVEIHKVSFFSLNLQAQAGELFFAVADLVAAVGLWLTAGWGIVVWFSAAAIRICRHTVFASSYGWSPVETALDIGAIILFLLLVVFARRERRLESARQRESRRSLGAD
ncbi:MAG: DUF6163 family protein [Ancalomicrobiaceae bacterium]|nr:DUF6163 family protein [Ancalomicrobiaceae bacterium]